jgi:flagellar basal-body rod protein FlgB
MRSLFPTTLNVIEKNLDLRHDRHKILSSNVANAETPGYVAKDLYFEEVLRQAAQPPQQGTMQRTHPHHFPSPSPSVTEVKGSVAASPSDDVGNDLNTVSLDQQMAKLTMNTFHYNASTEILSRMLGQVKRTITDGGR